MEAKKDYSEKERTVTVSELRKLIEEMPDGMLLQIEFTDSEDGEDENKS